MKHKVHIQHDCYRHQIGEYDAHVVKHICVDIIKALCGHYHEGYEVVDSGMSSEFYIKTPYLNYTVNDFDYELRLYISVKSIPIDKYRMGFKGMRIEFSHNYSKRQWCKIKQRIDLSPVIDDKCGNYHYYVDPDKMLSKLKAIEAMMLGWNDIRLMPVREEKSLVYDSETGETLDFMTDSELEQLRKERGIALPQED